MASDATKYSLNALDSALGTAKAKLDDYGVTHKVGALSSDVGQWSSKMFKAAGE